MELFAKRMTWELDNEEGLSFELEDGYFTRMIQPMVS